MTSNNNKENTICYSIGIVVEQLGIDPVTLRDYEREGLVKPSRRGGKRYYSENDLKWLRCLRKMMIEDGLQLSAIKKLLTIDPCWEINHCPREIRENCPAMLDFPVPCWELMLKTNKPSGRKCEECEVYRRKKERLITIHCCEP